MRSKCGILGKSVAGFELGILVLSLFAFSYLIYSADVVEAQTTAPLLTNVQNVVGTTAGEQQIVVTK